MKYKTTRDKEDTNGNCIGRLKRIKHEPLSPPPNHSEDEQSIASEESDDETELIARSRITSGHDGGLNRQLDNQHDRRGQTGRANNMVIKRELRNDATPRHIVAKGGAAGSQSPAVDYDNRPSKIDDDHEAQRFTSLTPPIDALPAMDNANHTTPPNTALTSNYADDYTQNTTTDDHGQHRHHNHHSHHHRRPSISRDRCDELKLSEQQQEYLSLIIRAIREGNFDKFSELLGRKRDSIKNLLNVFVDGQTALHYSLIYGRGSAWCKQLVMNGANPNQTNRAGWHPIHLAAYSGSPETMLYLIDCFAE
jgi:hypothetical protein